MNGLRWRWRDGGDHRRRGFRSAGRDHRRACILIGGRNGLAHRLSDWHLRWRFGGWPRLSAAQAAGVWPLGGRGTLIGPILGAGIVNGAKSYFTVAFPDFWLFFLGLMFILVTLFLPRGVIGLLKRRKHD